MLAFYSKIVANYWDAAIQNQKRGLSQHSTPFLYIETATVQFHYATKYISRDALSGSDPVRIRYGCDPFQKRFKRFVL